MSHVIISIIALLAGIPLILGFFKNVKCPVSSKIFVVTSVLTNVGGFGFPFTGLLPSHIVAIIALVFLVAALIWKKFYVIGMVANEYFLFFVLIAQGFQKVPALHVLAPTGSEPPFAIAQGILLVIFLYIGFKANRAYSPT